MDDLIYGYRPEDESERARDDEENARAVWAALGEGEVD
jgi:hypothetical protein